jgi:ASC-1-like (ASCH) protein
MPRSSGTLRKHLSEPWFSLVAVGAKTYEGRLNGNSDLGQLPIGSTVVWYNEDLGFRREVATVVTSRSAHKSFAAMLKSKGLGAVLPTVRTVQQGASVYAKFYSAEREAQSGVLCLGLQLKA